MIHIVPGNAGRGRGWTKLRLAGLERVVALQLQNSNGRPSFRILYVSNKTGPRNRGEGGQFLFCNVAFCAVREDERVERVVLFVGGLTRTVPAFSLFSSPSPPSAAAAAF